MDSSLPGFYKLSLEERLKLLQELAGLSAEEAQHLKKTGALDLEKAGMMIENVVGTFELPFGIAANFRINSKDYLIPMVIEEPSVVAGASNAAKLARPEGFRAWTDEPVMIGQVQLLGAKEGAAQEILSKKQELCRALNNPDSSIVKLGGGLKDLEIRELDSARGKMLVVHLLVDVRDAMGANAVNTIAEKAAPLLEEISGGEARLRIISNLADRRLARAEAVWKKAALEKSMRSLQINGEEVVDCMLDAYEFAAADPYRATTHNKGIMNGIDAVCIATGNDFRALESGAHAFASKAGYKPLTKFEKTPGGDLRGSIELPIAAGVVGGPTKTNPLARIGLKILGARTAKELAEIMAAVGLAQNFAALRALATEGIQRGHLRLHAKNFAAAAGAEGEEIGKVVRRLVSEGITASNAKRVLEEIRGNK